MNTDEKFGAIFSLATRFATEIASMDLPLPVIQKAKEGKEDHPLWIAVKGAMLPEEMPMSSPGLELGAGRQIAQVPEVFIPRIKILSERPKPCAQRSLDDQITDLKQMYQELRWTWTKSGLVIPPRQKGIDRLLVLADTGFTNNSLFDVCGNSFPSWRYVTDLDSGIPTKNDERHLSCGVYAIWVRDDDGPDRDLIGLSANQIKGRSLKTLTTLEREFLELVYHRETGRHLDISTYTLCSGSRYSDGCVPYASWNDFKFKVDWFASGLRYPRLGARQVVSL